MYADKSPYIMLHIKGLNLLDLFGSGQKTTSNYNYGLPCMLNFKIRLVKQLIYLAIQIIHSDTYKYNLLIIAHTIFSIEYSIFH